MTQPDNHLVFHAPNVHQGGGRTLLLPLLESCIRQNIPASASLDARLSLPIEIEEKLNPDRVYPSIVSRFRAEWRLAAIARDLPGSILCFGNLPPLFRQNKRVFLYMQNRYLVENISTKGFTWKQRLRIQGERWWFSLFRNNVDIFMVQSATMHRLLQAYTGRTTNIMIAPFMAAVPAISPSADDQTPPYDFLYVASGEPHKNHVNLLEAWRLMAEGGLFPSLCLTLDEQREPGIVGKIMELKRQHHLNVDLVGDVAPEKIQSLYLKSKALIFPSKLESFGLPLLEAARCHLPVIASELDYIRDVVNPAETFDPNSPVSIMRAVRRFLKIAEPQLAPETPDALIAKLLGKCL